MSRRKKVQSSVNMWSKKDTCGQCTVLQQEKCCGFSCLAPDSGHSLTRPGPAVSHCVETCKETSSYISYCNYIYRRTGEITELTYNFVKQDSRGNETKQKITLNATTFFFSFRQKNIRSKMIYRTILKKASEAKIVCRDSYVSSAYKKRSTPII